jgi:galactokinase/mevalonate kinase-like predicted kinase
MGSRLGNTLGALSMYSYSCIAPHTHTHIDIHRHRALIANHHTTMTVVVTNALHGIYALTIRDDSYAWVPSGACLGAASAVSVGMS